MNKDIVHSLENLEKYIRNENFSGYDPYDALNSELLYSLNSKIIGVFLTQLFVYSPVNMRSFFGINKGFNPKALGLFLSAYCNMYKDKIIDNDFFKKVTFRIVEILLDNASKNYSGYCWGYNFNWRDIKRNTKRYTPTLVVSTYVGNGFLDLYENTQKQKYFDIAESITKFIIHDLNIRKNKHGICFSYTPIDNNVVHNANCLGGAFLSRIYAYNNDKNLLDYSKKAFDFSISRQISDGSWEFQFFPESNHSRNQLDFHQGFIIDSLCDFIKYSNIEDSKYQDSLRKGVNFYKEKQFFKDGRAKWRLPLNYPIDIHHLAQGIITFIKMYELKKDTDYLFFAQKIATWTIKNMQNEKGYFYYQKWPFFTNKISYMRWSQAWIMLALSLLNHSWRENC